MFKQHFIIAAITTLLISIPLTILSARGFTLTLGNLPLIALSLFVSIVIALYCSGIFGIKATAASAGRKSGSTRETGSVKWFNANKGFGFITRDSGEDIFVHFRSIRGEGHRVLHDGQRVEYAVSMGEKGLQADDVAAMR